MPMLKGIHSSNLPSAPMKIAAIRWIESGARQPTAIIGRAVLAHGHRLASARTSATE
jgi:hypothetical protein